MVKRIDQRLITRDVRTQCTDAGIDIVNFNLVRFTLIIKTFYYDGAIKAEFCKLLQYVTLQNTSSVSVVFVRHSSP